MPVLMPQEVQDVSQSQAGSPRFQHLQTADTVSEQVPPAKASQKERILQIWRFLHANTRMRPALAHIMHGKAACKVRARKLESAAQKVRSTGFWAHLGLGSSSMSPESPETQSLNLKAP